MKPHFEFPQPARIETPRLLLRPMQEDDAPLIVEWRNEPSSRALFSTTRPITLEQHLEWFHGERQGRVDYTVVRKDDGRPIGVVNFRNIDEDAGCAESGRLIGDLGSRGQGYAREAAVTWLTYGFGTLRLRKIIGMTRRENHINIALNRSLGYQMQAPEPTDDPDFLIMVLRYRDTLANEHFQRFRQISHAGGGDGCALETNNAL